MGWGDVPQGAFPLKSKGYRKAVQVEVWACAKGLGQEGAWL